jgi:hypothetical protein
MCNVEALGLKPYDIISAGLVAVADIDSYRSGILLRNDAAWWLRAEFVTARG